MSLAHCGFLLPSSSRQRRSALSSSDGEIISSFRGFVGYPIYRPYGFGAWGWGSHGFGQSVLEAASPYYGRYQIAG